MIKKIKESDLKGFNLNRILGKCENSLETELVIKDAINSIEEYSDSLKAFLASLLIESISNWNANIYVAYENDIERKGCTLFSIGCNGIDGIITEIPDLNELTINSVAYKVSQLVGPYNYVYNSYRGLQDLYESYVYQSFQNLLNV